MSVVNDRLDAAFTVLAGRLRRANRITKFAFEDRVVVRYSGQLQHIAEFLAHQQQRFKVAVAHLEVEAQQHARRQLRQGELLRAEPMAVARERRLSPQNTQRSRRKVLVKSAAFPTFVCFVSFVVGFCPVIYGKAIRTLTPPLTKTKQNFIVKKT